MRGGGRVSRGGVVATRSRVYVAVAAAVLVAGAIFGEGGFVALRRRGQSEGKAGDEGLRKHGSYLEKCLGEDWGDGLSELSVRMRL